MCTEPQIRQTEAISGFRLMPARFWRYSRKSSCARARSTNAIARSISHGYARAQCRACPYLRLGPMGAFFVALFGEYLGSRIEYGKGFCRLEQLFSVMTELSVGEWIGHQDDAFGR
jgi:hypothetical protein